MWKTKLFPMQRGEGGNCWRPGCTYSLNCDECSLIFKLNNNISKKGKIIEVAQYKGETGKNDFERGKQNLKFLENKDTKESMLWLHSLHHHQGREDINYSMTVTGSLKRAS